MRILYCGTMVPEEIEYEVKDISAAGNRFQNNMIKNIKELGYPIKEMSYIGILVSEQIKTRLKEQQEREKGKQEFTIKGSNLLKTIYAYHKRIKAAMDDTDTVICYNITYAWLLLPFLARKKKVKSIVVLADYSESISYSSFFRKVYAWLQLWSMRRFDVVVGLSANIESKLKKKQQFVLMEGGIDEKFYNYFQYKPHLEGEPITYMYSGLLSKVTGVDLLLEAMKAVENDNCRLIITGKGELEDEVLRAASQDSRIIYKGHLTYEEYLEELQQADVLINPRNMELPENQNNFPSKIMDYLATGKPIISTKFVGWEKYKDYIFFCENILDIKIIQMQIGRMTEEELKKTFKNCRNLAKQFRWKNNLQRFLGEV